MHQDVVIPNVAAGAPTIEVIVQYGFAARGAAHAWIYDAAGDNPSDTNFDYTVDASGAQRFVLPVDAATAKLQKRFVYLLARVTSQGSLPAPVRAIVGSLQGTQPLQAPMAMNATVTRDEQVAEFEFTIQFS